MDGADVCGTSSRTSRRPPDVISAVAILDPRWRRRKWRHPGPGAGFSIPIAVRGAKWRPFRFRSPSWMTSSAGPGNEVIQDGDRKRKGRHFAPRTAMGIEKPALYYSCTMRKGLLCFFNQFGVRLLHAPFCYFIANAEYRISPPMHREPWYIYYNVWRFYRQPFFLSNSVRPYMNISQHLTKRILTTCTLFCTAAISNVHIATRPR